LSSDLPLPLLLLAPFLPRRDRACTTPRPMKAGKSTFRPPLATKASLLAGLFWVAKSSTFSAQVPAWFFSFMHRTMSSKPCEWRNRPWFSRVVSADASEANKFSTSSASSAEAGCRFR
jgi:hypothetical protein